MARHRAVFVVASVAAVVALWACGTSYTSDPTLEPDAIDASTKKDASNDGRAPSDGESDAAATDARADAASNVDASCDPIAPFTSIARITELDSYADDGRLQIAVGAARGYFESARDSGSGDIYTVPVGPGFAFGTPTLITELSTTADDGNPSPSNDGTFLLFASNTPTTVAGYNIFTATLESNGTYGTPQPALALDSPQNDGQPFLRADGKEVYFISDRNGNQDIFRASVNTGTFSTPTPVDEVNTVDTEFNPVISPDGLTLYFGSTHNVAARTFDVFRATRASTSQAFGAPTAVTELDTPSNDTPDWISADACTLVFQSDRPGGSGAMDLYLAKRTHGM